MEKQIRATEAVRRFSELLNMIKYQGESYTIVRGGKPVASLRPVEKRGPKKTLAELKEALSTIPTLGAESRPFEDDLREIRKNQPSLPRERRWG